MCADRGSALQCHYSGPWLRLTPFLYGKPYSGTSEVKGLASLTSVFAARQQQSQLQTHKPLLLKTDAIRKPEAVSHFFNAWADYAQAISHDYTCIFSFLTTPADCRKLTNHRHLTPARFILFFNLFKPSQRFCRKTCGCFRFVLEIFSPVQLRMKC